MHLRPKHLLAILAIAAVVGGFLFTKYQEKKSATDQPTQLTHIRMALPNNPVTTLAIIANAQGYLAEEGLAIDVLSSTNAKMSNDMLLANQADMTLGAPGPFNFISFTPHPLRILMETARHYDTAVFARKDRGIVKEEDLRGKKIGYLPGTVSFLAWTHLMDRHNWTMNDFEMVPLQPPAMPTALVGGSVDAFVMWQPWGNNAINQLPEGVVRLADDQGYYFSGMLYGRDDYIQQNPEAVKGLIRALIKAEDFANKNPEQTIRMVAEFVKTDPEQMLSYWDAYKFKIQLNPDLLNQFLENDRMIKKYMPEYADKPTPDFKSFINPEPLRSVAPERLTD
jgi:ABC-type nitrate/sulfonate/bicarbonate transport system substrate-binding protein